MVEVFETITAYNDIINAHYNPQNFVGRKWLIEEATSFRDDKDRRSLIIVGEPGSGKSSFLAYLAEFWNCPRHFIRVDNRSGVTGVDARAFLISLSSQLYEKYGPDIFERGISGHIQVAVGWAKDQAEVVGRFIDELYTLPFLPLQGDEVQVKVGVATGRSKVFGERVRRLIDVTLALDALTLLHVALINPLGKVQQLHPDEKVVILIDALDESMRHAGTTSTLDVLPQSTDAEFPPNLRLVMTSRNGEHLSKFQPSDLLYLDDKKKGYWQANQQDIRAYIDKRLAEGPLASKIATWKREEVDDYATQVVEHSQNNFLYLYHFFNELVASIQIKYTDMHNFGIPKGLSEIYRFFALEKIRRNVEDTIRITVAEEIPVSLLAQLKTVPNVSAIEIVDRDLLLTAIDSDQVTPVLFPLLLSAQVQIIKFQTQRAEQLGIWEEKYLPILGVMAVAYEPLYREQIAGFARVEVVYVDSVLAQLKQFLDEMVDEREVAYQFYHTSFSQYLLDSRQNRDYPLDGPKYHAQIATYYRMGKATWKEVDWETFTDRYLFSYLPTHLKAAGLAEELHALLQDFSWISAKLSTTDIHALISDYNLAGSLPHKKGQDDNLELIQRALQLSVHVLIRQKDQLWHQLYGRLGQLGHPLPIELPAKPNLGQYLLPLKPNLRSPESPLIHTMVGHWGTVIELVLTRDERRIISSSHDSTIRVWDLNTGKELKRLIGHTDSVQAIRLTPDERFIVSGAGTELGTWSDNSIRVWEIETEQNILTLSGNEKRSDFFILSHDENYHEEPIGGLAISPNGEYIVSASWDQTIKIWRIQDGALMRTLIGHTQGLNTVCMTSDGKLIISGASDGTIKIWDFHTGQEIRTIDAYGFGYVLSIALFPDEKRLVSASDRGGVKIWDLQTGQELRSLEWYESKVRCFAISPDGRYIAFGSSDNVICIWDSVEEVPIYQIRNEYSINSLLFTADKRLVAATGDYIRVWDVSDLNRLRRFPHRAIGHDAPVIQTAILKKLGLAITLDETGSAKLWDLTTGATVHTLENFGAAFVNCDDGRLISVAETYIKIWDASTWQPAQTFTTSIGYKYHVQKIEGIEVTSDNLLVICVRSAKWMSIRSFNLVSGELVYSGNFGYEDDEWEMFRIMAGFGEPVAYEVHNLSSGKMIITHDEGHAIFYFNFIKTIMGVDIRSRTHQGIDFLPIIGKRIEWNAGRPSAELVKAGFEREIFGDHGKLVPGVQDIAVTRDGRYLLAALTHGYLLKWDLKISAPPINFAGHERTVKFVRVLKDGERVLSVSDDGTIKIWHLNSGQCEQTLTGFTFEIKHIALSDDDSYLGISTRDSALLLWNLSTGQLITKFYGESDIDYFNFSPDGELVLAGERSGRVHILRLEHQ